eukprot:CAMPEP_0195112952 /NCGR_PEP_ID=MMETSP0448-20130528/100785_1 /TAXON_ID=66468 /ORGANISM="Heterocapsa triquestra, Strain CCMP 448" /LENGTH=53 /DNA_ID=CAMNT_0040149841 /DNA_START=162 /DNA_END=323 /DNA_ORIENTATION=-
MQPTPIWSPTLNFVTLLPTAATMPASSCPGQASGKSGMPMTIGDSFLSHTTSE